MLLILSSVSDNCQQYHAVVISPKKAAVEDNAQPHHGATGRVTPSGRRTAYARKNIMQYESLRLKANVT